MSDLTVVTEKGIFDDCFCPVLWLDRMNNPKRLKEERNWDPLESIQEAISKRDHTKRAYIEDVGNGVRAIPYSGDEFWLQIPAYEGKFLVVATYIEVDPLVGKDKTLTCFRKLKYPPRDPSGLIVEEHIQVLIHKHLKSFFSYVDHVIVRTQYPDGKEIITDRVDYTQGFAAQEWATQIQRRSRGQSPLLSKEENCRTCFWRECDQRVKNKPLFDLKGKGPTIVSI